MKKKGFTLIELLVVISIIAMLLAILMPALGKVKEMAQRVVCGTNCKGIGTSMIIYASDYDDSFPMSGGGNSSGSGSDIWGDGGKYKEWRNMTYNWASEQDDDLTASSCLYLLVREVDGDPAAFICKSADESVWENTTNYDLTQLYDFGGDPGNHVSYAYHDPWGSSTGDQGYPASGNAGSSFAILADKNPALDSTIEINGTLGTDYSDNFEAVVSQLRDDWSPDTEPLQKWEKAVANSGNHKREGQNVLFGDGHVTFERRPDVGVRNDNIYSPAPGGANANETQRRQGHPASSINIGSMRAKSRTDSYLINDEKKM